MGRNMLWQSERAWPRITGAERVGALLGRRRYLRRLISSVGSAGARLGTFLLGDLRQDPRMSAEGCETLCILTGASLDLAAVGLRSVGRIEGQLLPRIGRRL